MIILFINGRHILYNFCSIIKIVIVCHRVSYSLKFSNTFNLENNSWSYLCNTCHIMTTTDSYIWVTVTSPIAGIYSFHRLLAAAVPWHWEAQIIESYDPWLQLSPVYSLLSHVGICPHSLARWSKKNHHFTLTWYISYNCQHYGMKYNSENTEIHNS